ncbi:MAG: hypothetical protein M3Z92_08725, partial [Bacteroidota bacterium]|nr:hypothetical protein [Bacteroidota bacterium]
FIKGWNNYADHISQINLVTKIQPCYSSILGRTLYMITTEIFNGFNVWISNHFFNKYILSLFMANVFKLT